MKLILDRATFTKAMQTVSAAVPSRTTKDILKSVLMRCKLGTMTLLATDTEVGLRHEMTDINVDKAGEALLPTTRLLNILRELTADELVLTINDRKLDIKSGGAEFRLNLEDPGDYPSVSTFDDDSFFTIAGSTLRTLIKRTVFATDDKSSRYALSGVQIELSENGAIFAATDSKRLSVAHGSCKASGTPAVVSPAPVVPNKAMKLMETIAEGVQEVQIAIHANDIIVKCGQTTLFAQNVQGRFPDWKRVLPTDFKSSIDIAVGPFAAVIRQSMIVTSEESKGVEFSFSKGTLRLSAEVSDIGNSKIEMPISYEGEPMKLSVDPRYFSEFVKTLDSASTVKVQLISHEDPVVLQFGSDGDRVDYVVMPLQRG